MTVVSNTLEVDGAISESPSSFRLEKAGNGTLTLGTDNSFSGGMQLDSGVLNVKTANGLGIGNFIINNSATVDNISGADMTLTGITNILMPGSGATFTYLGTSNSLDLSAVPINEPSQGTLFVNVVSNTLTASGDFTSGNTTIIKIGRGTFVLGGFGVSQFAGIVNEGELDLGHDGGVTIGTGGNGFLVQSNAVAKITGASGNQISHGNGYILTRLNAGGILDLNGQRVKQSICSP